MYLHLKLIKFTLTIGFKEKEKSNLGKMASLLLFITIKNT